jgi:D,D-heptose 1,7-bisphosphate phosphatase
MNKTAAIFLDRDGVINEEVGYLDNLEKLKIIPCAFDAIRLINASGMKAVVISNQSGVARGFLTEEFVRQTNDRVQAMLRERQAVLDSFYYCPHHPTEGAAPYRRMCDCRKPAPGMFLRAAKDLNIDLELSYMVGDRFLDMEAAQTAGVKGVLVRTGYGRDLLQDDGPDRSTEENKPDFIATDILEAVQWILQDRQ